MPKRFWKVWGIDSCQRKIYSDETTMYCHVISTSRLATRHKSLTDTQTIIYLIGASGQGSVMIHLLEDVPCLASSLTSALWSARRLDLRSFWGSSGPLGTNGRCSISDAHNWHARLETAFLGFVAGHKPDCNKVFLIPGYSEGKLSCQELSVSQAPRHSLKNPSDDNVTFPLRKDHQVMTSMSIRSLQPPVS